MKKSLKRQEYQMYKNDKIKIIVKGMAILCFLSLFFYRSFYAIPALIPVFLLYKKEKYKELGETGKRELALQFKDAILSVSTNLKAGYSVENSFKQAHNDMAVLYGLESQICRELYAIMTGLSNNVTLEELLIGFGKRSRVEDISEFAEVFASAKRNGGNMTEIMERSAVVIAEKIEIEKEIQVMISARQMEQKIMNVVPFGIIFYIGITSKGFFDPMYNNPAGIFIMTICLVIYIFSVYLSRKIVNIKV